MGTLKFPASGLVYIDTPTAIYTVERHPTYAPVLLPLWSANQTGAFSIISSELTLMETLVVPLRNGDATLVSDYERLWQQTNTRLLPITLDILREAARLRAVTPALRTPDALHAATALLAGCALFVTNDGGFRRIPALPLAVLDEVLAAS